MPSLPLCLPRYRKPGNLSWYDCYTKMNSSKPEQLKDAFLYVSADVCCHAIIHLECFTWWLVPNDTFYILLKCAMMTFGDGDQAMCH